MRLLLGSQSPRRRELLAGLDIPFECVDIHADESFPPDLQAGDIPLYIAQAKAQAYLTRLHEGELLLTADTIVWVAGRMLGKPKDEEEAKAMLRLLSGKTHQVYTAVVLATPPNPLREGEPINGQLTGINGEQPQTPDTGVSPETTTINGKTRSQQHKITDTERSAVEQTAFVDCTDVTFRDLTDAEIDYYVTHYHPLDKAGAYGVQEYIGYIGVEKMVGSYYNVMGLPTERLYQCLCASPLTHMS